MDEEIHNYYRARLDEAIRQRDEMCEAQRQEITRLQGRCQEFALNESMRRAAIAFDIRTFVAQQGQATGTVAVDDVLTYLHTYSGGLVAGPDRVRKRNRHLEQHEQPSMAPAVSPLPQQQHLDPVPSTSPPPFSPAMMQAGMSPVDVAAQQERLKRDRDDEEDGYRVHRPLGFAA
jgi:hypothetical protein